VGESKPRKKPACLNLKLVSGWDFPLARLSSGAARAGEQLLDSEDGRSELAYAPDPTNGGAASAESVHNDHARAQTQRGGPQGMTARGLGCFADPALGGAQVLPLGGEQQSVDLTVQHEEFLLHAQLV